MTKPQAVIFDVDGTLCDVASVRHHLIVGHPENRGYKDFAAFHEESTGCPPHKEVLGINHALRPDIVRIVVTARMAQWYNHTLWWLLLNDVRFDHLFMRKWNDFRKDYIIKSEILETIQTRYDVVYAIDDNPSVLALWKEHSIPTLRIPGWEEWDN